MISNVCVKKERLSPPIVGVTIADRYHETVSVCDVVYVKGLYIRNPVWRADCCTKTFDDLIKIRVA